MSDIVARLVPMHGNSEKLYKNVSIRPTLQVHRQPPDQRPLRIGRNSQTGIGSDLVSRNAARVSWNIESTSLVLHCRLGEENQGAVLRNGERVTSPCVLSHGDVLSVGPNDPATTTHYLYRVELVKDSASVSGPAALPSHDESIAVASKPAATAAHATPTVCPLLFLGGVEEEVQCAVCMEICVEATALVPCSHFFCSSCARNLSSCPTCRKKVKSKMRLHAMDNLIGKLVQTSCSTETKSTVLDGNDDLKEDHVGDIEMYLERTKSTLPVGNKGKGAKKRAASKSPRRHRKKHAVASLSSGTSVDQAICLD